MKMHYKVSGMTCAACSARVEKVSRQISGVLTLSIQESLNVIVRTPAVDGLFASIKWLRFSRHFPKR